MNKKQSATIRIIAETQIPTNVQGTYGSAKLDLLIKKATT